MILLAVPAYMLCDEPGCEAKHQAHLYLTTAGTICFKPSGADSGWQVGARQEAQGDGPFLAMCPLHKKETPVIRVANVIPDMRRNH